MRQLLIMLIMVLLAPLASTSWADPGKDESGKRHFERHDRYAAYGAADREAWKRELEYRREAAKARREYEREEARARAELEREERKHYEEMHREAFKHREEMRHESNKRHEANKRREALWRDGYVGIETIVYVPWYD